MKRTLIKAALNRATGMDSILVKGWVRTRRDSKGFSFLEINDGSCLKNMQVIVDESRPSLSPAQGCRHRSGPGGGGRPRGVTRRRPEVGGQGLGAAPAGYGRPGNLSAAEEASHRRVPAHDRPPATANQQIRGAFPHPLGGRLRRAPLLPGQGVFPSSHPDPHRFRLRGRRRNVPGVNPAALPAGPPARGKPFRRGFLRQGGQPHGFRPARGRAVRLRAGQRLHLRAHLPCRKFQHAPACRGVLDDRAGDGLCRHRRRHGPGRGTGQGDDPACDGELPRGSRAVRQVRRQEPARRPSTPSWPRPT